MIIQALLLHRDLSLAVGERTIEAPPAGEVSVAVHRAGICGSDLHVLRTGDWVEYWPATLGHEVAGQVGTSSDPRWPQGTRVIVDSRMPQTTRAGLRAADRLSPDLSWLGEARPGGFAEAFNVSVTSLHAIPDGLDPDVAVLAEPLAVILCAFDRLSVAAPSSVVILGHGPIGFLSHTEARRRWPEAEIDVIDPKPARAQLARDLGARTIDRPGLGEYDLVIDAAGYPGSLTASIDAPRRGGSVLLVALGHQPVEVAPAAIVERSLTITGSVGFDTHHLDDALSVLARQPEVYRRAITHRIALRDLPAFLNSPARDEAMKILVDCRA